MPARGVAVRISSTAHYSPCLPAHRGNRKLKHVAWEIVCVVLHRLGTLHVPSACDNVVSAWKQLRIQIQIEGAGMWWCGTCSSGKPSQPAVPRSQPRSSSFFRLLKGSKLKPVGSLRIRKWRRHLLAHLGTKLHCERRHLPLSHPNARMPAGGSQLGIPVATSMEMCCAHNNAARTLWSLQMPSADVGPEARQRGLDLQPPHVSQQPLQRLQPEHLLHTVDVPAADAVGQQRKRSSLYAPSQPGLYWTFECCMD